MGGGALRKALALLVLSALLIAALAGSFELVEIGPTGGRADIPRIMAWSGDADLPVDQPYPPAYALFEVENALKVSHLRTGVLYRYEDGAWLREDVERKNYHGDLFELPEYFARSTYNTLKVTPLRAMEGLLPVPRDTAQLIVGGGQPLEYSRDHQTFRVGGTVQETYTAVYRVLEFDEAELRNAFVYPSEKDVLLPEGLDPRIGRLADLVVQGASTPYDKAVAIREFLRTNYLYDAGYAPAPPGEDPVAWFLFHSKTGICTHFNSAFVLMARSAGLPARMVTGFLIDPLEGTQTVRVNQSHAYAEVRLEGKGWITFDAVPGAERVDRPDQELRSIGGTLFEDLDGDGLRHPAEPGMINWTVALYDRHGVIADLARTDGEGRYLFNLTSDGPTEWVTVAPLYPEGWMARGALGMTFDVVSQPLVADFPYQRWLAHGETGTVTTITEAPEVALAGIPFSVAGTVTEGTLGARYMRVQVFLSEQATGALRWVCGEGSTVDGSFNVSCLVPPDLPLGDYRLIARAVDDTYYAPSEDDVGATVRASSVLTLKGPDLPLVGAESVYTVRLVTGGSGAPVANADVIVTADQEHRVTMGADGTATVVLSFHQQGGMVLNATYPGGGERQGDSVELAVRAVYPAVELASAVLVRNETAMVIGVVTGDGIPLPDSAVQIRLDGEDLTEEDRTAVTARTDQQGMFMLPMTLSGEVGLGDHLAVVTLSTLDELEVVRVVARPVLEAHADGDVLRVSLLDDLGVGLAGQAVDITVMGQVLRAHTDDAGAASLPLPAGAEGNCTVAYAGTAELLAIETTVALADPQAISPWVLALPALAVAAAVLTLGGRRRERPEPAPSLPAAEVAEVAGPYIISSPLIPSPLPLVWAAGEPLPLTVSGAAGAAVRLDGAEIGPLGPGGEVTVTLTPGTHVLEVEGEEGLTRAEVRGVDYREEVGRLFDHAVARWRTARPDLTDDRTPREILAALRPDRSPAGGRVAELVEKAVYSEHPVDRADYEAMFLSLLEVTP